MRWFEWGKIYKGCPWQQRTYKRTQFYQQHMFVYGCSLESPHWGNSSECPSIYFHEVIRKKYLSVYLSYFKLTVSNMYASNDIRHFYWVSIEYYVFLEKIRKISVFFCWKTKHLICSYDKLAWGNKGHFHVLLVIWYATHEKGPYAFWGQHSSNITMGISQCSLIWAFSVWRHILQYYPQIL